MNSSDIKDADERALLGPKFMASIHHDGQLSYRQRERHPRAFLVERKRPSRGAVKGAAMDRP